MFRDVQTIDAMNSLKFKDPAAREKWCSLIENQYFFNREARASMDFARRWAKIMQHMMDHESKSFNDVILPAARDANIDNASAPTRKKALDILISIWSNGESLREWFDKSDHQTVSALFA